MRSDVFLAMLSNCAWLERHGGGGAQSPSGAKENTHEIPVVDLWK
jgi:hypothetical protein